MELENVTLKQLQNKEVVTDNGFNANTEIAAYG